MIIETSANQLFRVTESTDAALSHCYLGIEVKRSKGAFVPKAKAKEILIRKQGTRIIQGA